MKKAIGKIVELLIDWDDKQFEDLGVDVVSLVESPAIGISWQAFNAVENKEMINGIVDLLNQVEDAENRKEIAQEAMEGFKEEGIEYDKEDFLERIGLHEMPNGDLMEGVAHKNSMEFETYNDYPESAKNNAQRAIDWAEENGWGTCGTNVGKQRAHQLAKGENISEDTIARMSSFTRHKKNSKTPYSEGCGKLMWDAWGGTSGIEWASNKLKSIRSEKLEEVDPIILMASHPDFGEVLDYKETIEISQKEAGFSELSDTLKAIVGLDILGKKNPTDEGEIKYRYAGPTAERTFCKSLLSLGKVYTDKEIERLTGLHGQENYNSASPDNFFKYKAGNHCRHYWEQVRIFRDGRKTVVVSEGPASGIAGESMEEQPNGGRISMAQWNFSEDDQMIITGPSMTPGLLIPRRSEDGSIFHVYFTADTIAKISKKFLEDNKQHQTDINHDGDVVKENTLLESWIVSDPEMDKSKSLGFNVPKGTWMISYRINNKETWKKIKEGKLNGFSIEGSFIEKASK